jgi:hypothetical protein
MLMRDSLNSDAIIYLNLNINYDQFTQNKICITYISSLLIIIYFKEETTMKTNLSSLLLLISILVVSKKP